MNWKKRYETFEPKIGMKLFLKEDTDKTNWAKNIYEPRYGKVLEIVKSDGEWVTFEDRWTCTKTFIKEHFRLAE